MASFRRKTAKRINDAAQGTGRIRTRSRDLVTTAAGMGTCIYSQLKSRGGEGTVNR
jgi:hypothetical protein